MARSAEELAIPAATTNGNSGKQQLDAAKTLATAPTLARFVRRSVLTRESDTLDRSSCFSYSRPYPLDRRRARPITVIKVVERGGAKGTPFRKSGSHRRSNQSYARPARFVGAVYPSSVEHTVWSVLQSQAISPVEPVFPHMRNPIPRGRHNPQRLTKRTIPRGRTLRPHFESSCKIEDG